MTVFFVSSYRRIQGRRYDDICDLEVWWGRKNGHPGSCRRRRGRGGKSIVLESAGILNERVKKWLKILAKCGPYLKGESNMTFEEQAKKGKNDFKKK